jgi:hypothetical protein
MSFRGERWADIVERAQSSAPRRARSAIDLEDPAKLAAAARPWPIQEARIVTREGGVRIGIGMESLELAFAQLYHVEPVDPWPALALGWVERGASHSCVLTPAQADAEDFARQVENALEHCAARVPRAIHRGWLEIPEQSWETTDALPGERDEGPMMRGYRVAPGVSDPVVASRIIAHGAPRLITWLAARIRRPPRRIEPRQIVLTQAFVYARTTAGVALRIPAGTLRAVRRTDYGDAVYVFGRNTELLLVFREECPLAAALDARVPK